MAKHTNSLVSESKILSQLSSLGKAVIVSVDNLEVFNNHYLDIKREIEKLKKSELYHIHIEVDGNFTKEVLHNRNISDIKILNLVLQKFRDYAGYCFVIDSGMQYLLENGEFSESVGTCLQKIKSMQEKLELLKPVSSIKEVFAHFLVDCQYEEYYYDKYFDKNSGKVYSTVKEQELRNILLNYLDRNLKGEVCVEFCTDYHNDEESVDIYVNDGTQRAIIEVKFSLATQYYDGTYYSITDRFAKGIQQLDKYAIHLAKDSRLVDYAYVYMFYMSKLKLETIRKRFDKKYELLKIDFSNDLISIYEGYELNDMKKWGTMCERMS